MQTDNRISALLLGLFIFLGLSAAAFVIGEAAIQFKEYERSVSVKGLSEREYDADLVIWPIQFTEAGNSLADLYGATEAGAAKIKEYLEKNGVRPEETSLSTPAITDKSAQQYGNSERPEFRYTAVQTVTVYSRNIALVHRVMASLSELGKKGIAFTGGEYQTQPEYMFTRLNEVKPEMVEEATRNAREVAVKFASDSKSTLGKIKKASQGQFSIEDRDKNNPHIKKVRVVSTVEYYLSD